MERLNIKDIKAEFTSLKKMESFKYLQLKKSIKKYGQLRPLIVNKNLILLDGYLLYSCLIELKYDEVYVQRIDEEDIHKFRLSYNSLSFDLDQIKFLSLLKNIEIKNNDHIFPYTNEELLSYQHLLNFDWEKYKTKISSNSLF